MGVVWYVKKKTSQHMVVLGYSVTCGLVMGVTGREGYLYRDGMYWVLPRFWLNLDKVLR